MELKKAEKEETRKRQQEQKKEKEMVAAQKKQEKADKKEEADEIKRIIDLETQRIRYVSKLKNENVVIVSLFSCNYRKKFKSWNVVNDALY